MTIDNICKDLKQIESNNNYYIDQLFNLLKNTLATIALDLDKKETLKEVQRFCKLHPDFVNNRINENYFKKIDD